MTDLELKLLLAACIRGEEPAWKDFIRRFHPLIKGTIFRHSSSGTEDMVQQVYEALIRENYRALVRFQGAFPAFLLYVQKIARNVVLTEARKRKTTVPLDAIIEGLTDASPTPEAQLASRESAETLHRAIAQLKPAYAEIIVHLLQGFNHRQIGELVDIPLGTVLVRAHRAKKILRGYLKIEIMAREPHPR